MNSQFDRTNIPACELDVGGCASFGLDELRAALQKHGARTATINHWTQTTGSGPLLIIGTTQNRRIQMLLESAGVDHRGEPESLFVHWCAIPGSRALVLAGTDDNGLM